MSNAKLGIKWLRPLYVAKHLEDASWDGLVTVTCQPGMNTDEPATIRIRLQNMVRTLYTASVWTQGIHWDHVTTGSNMAVTPWRFQLSLPSLMDALKRYADRHCVWDYYCSTKQAIVLSDGDNTKPLFTADALPCLEFCACLSDTDPTRHLPVCSFYPRPPSGDGPSGPKGGLAVTGCENWFASRVRPFGQHSPFRAPIGWSRCLCIHDPSLMQSILAHLLVTDHYFQTGYAKSKINAATTTSTAAKTTAPPPHEAEWIVFQSRPPEPALGYVLPLSTTRVRPDVAAHAPTRSTSWFTSRHHHTTRPVPPTVPSPPVHAPSFSVRMPTFRGPKDKPIPKKLQSRLDFEAKIMTEALKRMNPGPALYTTDFTSALRTTQSATTTPQPLRWVTSIATGHATRHVTPTVTVEPNVLDHRFMYECFRTTPREYLCPDVWERHQFDVTSIHAMCLSAPTQALIHQLLAEGQHMALPWVKLTVGSNQVDFGTRATIIGQLIRLYMTRFPNVGRRSSPTHTGYHVTDALCQSIQPNLPLHHVDAAHYQQLVESYKHNKARPLYNWTRDLVGMHSVYPTLDVALRQRPRPVHPLSRTMEWNVTMSMSAPDAKASTSKTTAATTAPPAPTAMADSDLSILIAPQQLNADGRILLVGRVRPLDDATACRWLSHYERLVLMPLSTTLSSSTPITYPHYQLGIVTHELFFITPHDADDSSQSSTNEPKKTRTV